MPANAKKNVPTCDNFRAVIRGGGYYVDKTQFIERLIDATDMPTAFLFTRPRRFGKSMAMSMVASYFDCNAPAEDEKLFNGLYIANAEEKYRAEFHKYPVIELTFVDSRCTTWQQAQDDLRGYLSFVCCRYKALRTSDKLDDDDKAKLRKLCNEESPFTSFKRTLSVLSELLHKHYGQPAIILIDEYDTPIRAAYEHGYYEEAIAFFRDFLCNGFKANDHLRFGILTGIMRIAKESIFSGLNNLIVDSVLDDEFADIFGFTQAEVNAMVEYYECADKLPLIKRWYDGYLFGTTEIYNPWSLTRYIAFRHKPAEAYWVNTADNHQILDVIEKLPAHDRELVLDLLNAQEIESELSLTMTFRDRCWRCKEVYGFLLMSGYLKARRVGDSKRYLLSIPNYEVLQMYQDEIVQHLATEVNFSGIDHMLKAVVQGDSVNFQEQLNEFMFHCSSFYDITTGKSDDSLYECCYHNLVLGLMAGLMEDYMLRSNRESGLGRPDVLLVPKAQADLMPNCSALATSGRLPVIVIEIKRPREGENLKSAAQRALLQAQEKRYGEDLSLGRTLLRYGIAFAGKEVALASEVRHQEAH